jgi:membrane protein required for colicin V production
MVAGTGGIFLMNGFDAVVYLALAVAMVTGFNTGLLRSAITILAYLVAMPLAIWLVPLLPPQLDGKLALPFAQNLPLFFGAFLVTGMVLGKLARMILDDVIGPQAGIGDRLGGATLGAVRVGLIAITVVLIFDQLVPTNLQPAFMTGSRLRPMLSAAGQLGVKSLPPDLVAAIDRLKKDRHI